MNHLMNRWHGAVEEGLTEEDAVFFAIDGCCTDDELIEFLSDMTDSNAISQRVADGILESL